jgi:hypothetical protein
MCGEEVSTSIAYQRVVGWARPRRAGGVNQVVLREVREEFACQGCIDRARAGLPAGQERLIA